ncbi:putative membrane protein [Corynebacterium glutamicum MB001]|uniref:Hypothetical membrane protein n=1 Tax=Corynebacterium glutamicum (strain ATCC 13032 / DSM 20300 / JCM 1318 / BCRC 11384 / CCUG 27702 / LMG 3730 / NBRC 12168 / NCIMB 10025 / NRRL B-2784 / 534) TaxID=196627 RepID=Q8NR91_CORGL|nr:hypothetical protein [Corynebacterium glutamicum]AGT05151.1 putative membrane protein [Corynebacterium glutamicum MB001]ARV64680.1 DUF2269 domain-containing protein [Corynebacterium glutamicum]ASW13800.1 putative membrane protein [Corynebacterium glutamicum]AUI00699.1 DUF2269 domain-containing protein [Corynebacterium glutamicum]AUI04342.1 DUF2269 domain-containing protein [Corynebacterium glutamicum]
MTTIMIAIHAIAAILFLGPATVANSQFHVRAYDAHNGNTQAAGSAKTLFKISQSYGMLSLLVPLLGIAIMLLDWSFYKSEGQFHAAIALSVITWALLLFVIFPRQKKMMGALDLLEDDEQAAKTYEIENWDKAKSQLSMFGGIWALLWVIIAVLMFI